MDRVLGLRKKGREAGGSGIRLKSGTMAYSKPLCEHARERIPFGGSSHKTLESAKRQKREGLSFKCNREVGGIAVRLGFKDVGYIGFQVRCQKYAQHFKKTLRQCRKKWPWQRGASIMCGAARLSVWFSPLELDVARTFFNTLSASSVERRICSWQVSCPPTPTFARAKGFWTHTPSKSNRYTPAASRIEIHPLLHV